jgi:hypothetical protein
MLWSSALSRPPFPDTTATTTTIIAIIPTSTMTTPASTSPPTTWVACPSIMQIRPRTTHQAPRPGWQATSNLHRQCRFSAPPRNAPTSPCVTMTSTGLQAPFPSCPQ